MLETLYGLIHNIQIWVCIGWWGQRGRRFPGKQDLGQTPPTLGREPSTGIQTTVPALEPVVVVVLGGSRHLFLAQPKKTYFCFELSSLSSPLELQSLRQITRVIFLFFFLSPSLAGTVQWQLDDITDVQGGSSPGSALLCAPPQHCFPEDNVGTASSTRN